MEDYDNYLGEIRNFGFSRIPKGWASCDGQILKIEEYGDLYSIIGITYGGDGHKTFALPDLRGRVPINQGLMDGSSEYFIGFRGGQESIALTKKQMPAHSHSILVSQMEADTDDPSGAALANARSNLYASPAANPTLNTELRPGSISLAGDQMPIENRQPFLVTNYCIALEGTYPPRS